MADHLIRALLRSHNVRLVAALTTDLGSTAAARHKASPAAACALGRGLTAGLLLATLSKTQERVTIQLVGNGPLRGVTVDAYGDGLARGYPLEAQACAGVSMAGRQLLAPLIGRDGVVNLVRDIGLRDRYQGQVSLVTSEIDEDVEAYLRDSEQIPSALGCEVVIEEDGRIASAGGLLAQIMPDSPQGTHDLLRELQHSLRTGALYDLLRGGVATAREILELAAGPYVDQLELFDERPLRFQCHCDLQRIEAMLGGLDTLALDEMISDGQAAITCNYCSEVYTVPKEDLLRLRAQKPSREQQ